MLPAPMDVSPPATVGIYVSISARDVSVMTVGPPRRLAVLLNQMMASSSPSVAAEVMYARTACGQMDIIDTD